jgi:hypothetical protein
VTGRTTEAVTASAVFLAINSDASAIYDSQTLSGQGAVSSAEEAFDDGPGLAGYISGASATAGCAGSLDILIPDYRANVFHKTWLTTGFVKKNASANGLTLFTIGGSWRNAAVITAVSVSTAPGTFDTGTVVSLYGRP